MKSLLNLNDANFRHRPVPAVFGIPAKLSLRIVPAPSFQQRGVVLFLTLLALLVMSLAAVALIRSVDTGTLIAGNLAFKQAATTSGDARVEDAINWLAAMQNASTGSIFTDSAHTLNQNFPAKGYYSFIDPNKSLTDGNAASHFKWDDNDSSPQFTDNIGNKKRYIIQRACRDDSKVVDDNDCLFGDSVAAGGDPKSVKKSSEMCNSCGDSGSRTLVYRITVQSIGKKNSISYVQAFAYITQ